MGERRCQYLWVFGEACFSVGCDDGDTGCLPKLVPTGIKMDSVYVKMQYVDKGNDLNDMEETLDNQLIDKSRNKDRDDDDDGANEKGHSLGPVADAGENLTVLMPVDVVYLYGNSSKSDQVSLQHTFIKLSTENLHSFISIIVLLFDSLTLSLSPMQGIKSYLWQLISDHFVHPILENSNSPVLQIRNLIPGNYTFRLTVTDPDDQSSSTFVVVHVLEGQ